MTPIFFNAIHAPVGAFASFTLGSKGASGGLDLELGGPAMQNVFIGIETDRAYVFEALPFFAHSSSPLEKFGLDTAEVAASGRIAIRPVAEHAISRSYTITSDRWETEDVKFTIYNQAPALPDPRDESAAATLRLMLFPGVTAEMEIDNTASDHERTAFFGFAGNDPYCGMRTLRPQNNGMCAIGQGHHLAVFTDGEGVLPGIGFSAEEVLAAHADSSMQRGLGEVALLVYRVPAGKRKTIRLVITFFRESPPVVGCNGRYWYRRYFGSITDAGRFGIEHFDELKNAAESDGRRFASDRLSDDRAFMLAHAVKSYYGSTQLLDAPDGPLWIVNEGEYRMINTLDLTVDHQFFELAMHPWTVKNVLDRYAGDYSFVDTVKEPSGVPGPGGIGFSHDMGVANILAPSGTSAYEVANKTGCFSCMTHEELMNWVLAASGYLLYTGDRQWLQNRKTVFIACLESLINRDHPDEEARTGTMMRDTVRTGCGSEITTYDSLDPSLGRARGNSYVTVKRWAAFVMLHRLLMESGEGTSASVALNESRRAAGIILHSVNKEGFIPALLEDNAPAVALPLIEGLIYPWFAGCRDIFSAQNEFTPFIAALKRHFITALSRERCLDADGGWILCSSSPITWLSKLYLFRFVATEIFAMKADEIFTAADAAHRGWLVDEQNSFHAWSDQFRNGMVIGSRYYPRGVTAILWLQETGSEEKGPQKPAG